MKKTFTLVHPKIKPARMIDAVRRDVKKYLKRESGKRLPKGFNVWEFDCKIGLIEEEAKVVSSYALAKHINKAEERGDETIYIEIFAKAGKKEKTEKAEKAESDNPASG